IRALLQDQSRSAAEREPRLLGSSARHESLNAISPWPLLPLRDQAASGVSVMASGLSPVRTSTLAIPSNERSCSAGKGIGPGPGAVPGAGGGKPVERAGWEVLLPSTFCTIW